MARGKKQLKIMVSCNLLTLLDTVVYPNHMNMWYHLGKSYPEHKFFFATPRRMPIDTARNMTAKEAIGNECDYIFFYDDDVVVPPDALKKMLALNADVAAGLTYIRGYPFNPMIFDMKKVRGNFTLPYMTNFKKKSKGTVVDCYAVGFSCALIKVETLKKIPAPYFMTGTNNTEDVYYCCKLKDYVPNAKIQVDWSINTAHLLDKMWVDDTNVEKLRKFYKPEEEKVDGDRTYEKAKKALEVVGGSAA